MEAVREYLRSTGERAIKAEIALQRGAEEAARTHATEATNAATEVKAKEAAAQDRLGALKEFERRLRAAATEADLRHIFI